MFNKQKLSTNKFVDALRDTFVPSTSYINDISREDLELLFNTQQQEEEKPDHGEDLKSPSDAEMRNAMIVDASMENIRENVVYEQQHLSDVTDDTIGLVKKRTGFDETDFRSQLTSLHTSTQSAFKMEVDSLYDLIDAHVNKISQSLLITQHNVMQEAEELIKETKGSVLEAEEMEREMERFMEAVQMAYERAFPKLRAKD